MYSHSFTDCYFVFIFRLSETTCEFRLYDFKYVKMQTLCFKARLDICTVCKSLNRPNAFVFTDIHSLLTVFQIVQQNTGRQSRHKPEKPVKKQEKPSIFTEAEFQKFQEEYFSNL